MFEYVKISQFCIKNVLNILTSASCVVRIYVNITFLVL